MLDCPRVAAGGGALPVVGGASSCCWKPRFLKSSRAMRLRSILHDRYALARSRHWSSLTPLTFFMQAR